MLHFTKQYKDTLQAKLMILMSFCSKFIRVYVYRLLLQYKKIWQNYCKSKMVQFFALQCREINENVKQSRVHNMSVSWLLTCQSFCFIM